MAADASAVRAGKAFVELGANDSLLVKVLDRTRNKLNAWAGTAAKVGGTLAAAGAGIYATAMTAFGAIGELAKKIYSISATGAFIELGKSLADFSKRTGISVEALSELRGAVDLEDLERGLRLLQRTMVEAGEGSVAAQGALARFGVTAAQLQQLNPEQQMIALADAMVAIPDPAQRTAAALDLFGRSGAQLLPFLLRGGAGIEEIRARMRELGLTMSNEDAQSAKSLGKEIKFLKQQFEAITIAIGAATAPALKAIVGWLQKIVPPIIEWIKANREIIATVFAVAAGLVAAGAAIAAIAAIIKIAAIAVGVLIIAVKALIAVFTFLISPIGLTILAIAAAIAAVIHFTDSWDAAGNWFEQTLGDIFASFTYVWNGISDAISAGRLDLAFKIAWLAVKAVWTSAINEINFFFLDWLSAIDGAFDDAATGVVAGAVAFWGELQLAFYDGTAAITEVWHTVMDALQVAWIQFVGAVRRGWAYISALAESGGNATLASQTAAIEDQWTQLEVRRVGNAAQERQAGAAQGRQNFINDNGTDGFLNALMQGLADRDAERAAALTAQRNAADAEIASAEGELAAAIAEAAAAREQADRKRRLRFTPGVGLGTAETARELSTTSATFSSAQAGAFGFGSSPFERTARATEQSASSLRRIENEIADGGLAVT